MIQSSQEAVPHASPEDYRVIRWSLATALSLAILKLAIGFLTQSLAILASAADSLMDILASGFNYVSLRASSSPPDDEHPYGHGKLEALAGLLQCVFIAGSAGAIIWQAILRLIRGTAIDRVGWGVATMALSAVMTALLVLRLRRAARQTGSVILASEELHYATDVWSNAGVLLTMILIKTTGIMVLDPLVSFLVAFYILSGAGRILHRSIHELLDRRLPDEQQAKLAELILSHDPRISGFHNLRTRRSGAQTFIDVHVVFKDEDSFRAVHDTTESLIERIRQTIPHSEVVVHMDTEDGP